MHSAQSALDFPLELCPEPTRFQGSYLEILQNQAEFCKDINSRSELSAWGGTIRCAAPCRSSCFRRLEEAINRVPPDCQSTRNSNTEQIRNAVTSSAYSSTSRAPPALPVFYILVQERYPAGWVGTEVSDVRHTPASTL